MILLCYYYYYFTKINNVVPRAITELTVSFSQNEEALNLLTNHFITVFYFILF